MSYTWIPGQQGGGGNVEETTAEWEEHWTVSGYDPPMGEPAAFGLLLDRPEFRPGQRHYNPSILAKVVGFDADRLGSVKDAWVVVVRYRQELATSDPNPLNQPPEIDLDSESEEVPIFLNADRKPILNTAGDLVAGLTEELSYWVFNVSVNLPSIPRWLLDYRNAVNSDTVRVGGITIEPGHLLLKNPRAGKVERPIVNGQEIAYVPFTFSLVFHPWSWKLRYLNRGLFEWKEVDVPAPTEENQSATRKALQKVRITIKDADGEEEPVDESQFLDREGRTYRERVPRIDPDTKEQAKDANGDPIYDEQFRRLTPDEIIVLEEWTKRRLPFSRLPIK